MSKVIDRRDAIKVLGATAAASCTKPLTETQEPRVSAIIDVSPLGFPWRTPDPFLFCVHHDDHYPAGNERMGPAASLSGRLLGEDFAGKDGWRMYHGHVVPGFPQHPHRGFETVTIPRRGLLDHSDSLGAAARFGRGDVQWLTAGRGILHAEMFPLLEREKDNPLELFQIWLNLPRVDKMVEPHFTMLWSHTIPTAEVRDEAGRTAHVTVIAGRFGEHAAPPPPPKSWAARPDTDVAIWAIKLAPNARLTLPASAPGSNRRLYFFKGSSLSADGGAIPAGHSFDVRAGAVIELVAGPDESELLMLQGRPINEPVVQHGPFVMTSREEIRETFLEYQRTQFGGWPWKSSDPVHPREEGRFARHADGRVEKPV